MRILDDELRFDEQNGMFATNTSAYIKSGLETRFAMGMSKDLYTFANKGNKHLYGGIKLNFIHMELSKQLIALQQLNGESIEDVVKDAYHQNLAATNNIAIDLGLMLIAENYSLGFTVTDLKRGYWPQQSN